MRRRELLTLLGASTLRGAVSRDSEIAAWIRTQGGEAQLRADGRLVRASLAYTWVNDTDMRNLEPALALESLDLSATTITYRGLARLKPLPAVRNLRLFYTEFVVDTAMAQIRHWDRLESLVLQGTDITDTSLEYVGNYSNLRSLDISFTQITDNGLEYLGDLSKIEELVLGGNKVSGAGLPVIQLLPRLRRLDLRGVQKRNSGFWSAAVTDFEVEFIGQCPQLESLNLEGMKLTDLGVEQIAASLKRLRELDLGRTAVSAAGVRSLEKLGGLERLRLWESERIDDAAAEGLSRLRSLQELDLTGTKIGDRTVDALAALPELRWLGLVGTGVTRGAITRLEQARPDCVVAA